MATTDEIEQALANDPDFLELSTSDPEKAEAMATAAFQEASDFQKPPGPLRQVVRPTLEGLGGLGGAAIGAAGGPITAAAGGILGVGMGASLSDIVEQAFGEQEQFESVTDALGRTVGNLQAGGTAEATGLGVSSAAKGIGNVLQRHVSPAMEKIVEIGKKLGIPLSPADVTKSKPLALVESLLENLPFSASTVQKFRMGQLEKLTKERNRLLEVGGSPEHLEAIGVQIKEEVNAVLTRQGIVREEAQERLRNVVLERIGSQESFEQLGKRAEEAITETLQTKRGQVEQLFQTAFDQLAEDAQIPQKHLAKAVEDLGKLVRGLKPETVNKLLSPKLIAFLDEFRGEPPDPSLLKVIEATLDPTLKAKRLASLFPGGIKGRVKTMDPRTLQTTRNLLSEAIDELDVGAKLKRPGLPGLGSGGKNFSGKQLNTLKSALDQDVMEFATTAGSDFQGAIATARAASGELKTLANSDAVQSFLRAKTEEAVVSLVRGGDLASIRNVRQSIGEENFKIVQQGLSNMLMGIGREGQLNGRDILRTINRMGSRKVREVLGDDGFNTITGLAKELQRQDAIPIGNKLFKSILQSNPEKVVGTIVKPGNTANINLIRRTLGNNAVKQLAMGTLRNILQTHEVDGGLNFSPAKMATRFRALGQNTVKTLFQHDKNFLSDLEELATISQNLVAAERLANNPSGTARGILTFIQGGAVLHDPTLGTISLVSPWGVANLYFSQAGRQAMIRGLRISPTAIDATAMFGRLLSLAAQDPNKRTLRPPIREARQIRQTPALSEFALTR